MSASDQLLVLIDPVARRHDGESVRIAKDVLSAGAALKVCLPEGPEEFARALVRRGSRRPVVVGDDRALLRTVSLLHRERELTSAALSFVPVGSVVSLARGLGVPTGAVAAARAVLEGVERRLDLLVDDSDGIVLGDLRIPSLGGSAHSTGDGTRLDPAGATALGGGSGPAWVRRCRSVVRALGARASRGSSVPGTWAAPTRLRVEADGVTLVDLDQPVEAVSLSPAEGFARVKVRPSSVGAEATPVETRARTVTVSGPSFRYRADTTEAGPVRTRTWSVRPGAWALTLPLG